MTLDELQAIYDKTTPGEWIMSDGHKDYIPRIQTEYVRNEDGTVSGDQWAKAGIFGINTYEKKREEYEANTKFVIAAHECMPKLIAELKEAREQIEELKWEIDFQDNGEERMGPYLNLDYPVLCHLAKAEKDVLIAIDKIQFEMRKWYMARMDEERKK